MGHGGDFCSSFGAYCHLLRHMYISCDMFTCSNGWQGTFQAWNVVFSSGTLLVTLVSVVIYLVKYFQYYTAGSIVDILISSFITMLIQLFVSYLGWFCVVVKDGCCGCIGYALWGVVYLLVFLSRYSPRFLERQNLHSSEFVRDVNKYFFYGQQHSDWADIVYAVLLVPIVYMSLSCFALACGGASSRSRGNVVLQSDSSSEESDSVA
ncbi:unnamed protein product [Polarella glacialis]|uniref:Uncharacterized protein n=1 Tax=Polarella glacialis TaxID=89957 RepID=A0A813EQL1_POLGL|nr:unnamed protein product [Polarella glacialis]